MENGLWAPAPFPPPTARKPGSKGRCAPGHDCPFGPEVIEKNWVAVWFESSVAQGTNSVLTAKVPHWLGVARMPRSEPKKWRSNSVNGDCGRSSKTAVS